MLTKERESEGGDIGNQICQGKVRYSVGTALDWFMLVLVGRFMC